jgi:hypothetical protein
MISDGFDLKAVDGTVDEADCQMITTKKDADVYTFAGA